MLKKVVVGVPLLTLVGLCIFVIFLNLDSSDSASVQEEKVNDTKTASFDSSENVFTDPKEYGQPIENSRFGEPKDFILAIHREWSEMARGEQNDISSGSESYGLISALVTEINYLRANIDGALTAEFDALQETAFKLTDSSVGLTEKERTSLIPRFENQLNELFSVMMNR
ncbi:hypothetical protein M4S82_07510 [Planococcus sp. MERTA32b]|nr:hypothetical protein [Planococcus sp. MER TA 32b]